MSAVRWSGLRGTHVFGAAERSDVAADKNVRAPLPPGTCSPGGEKVGLLQYREKSEGESAQTNRLSVTDRGFAKP
jgi:hypothetical protein